MEQNGENEEAKPELVISLLPSIPQGRDERGKKCGVDGMGQGVWDAEPTGLTHLGPR